MLKIFVIASIIITCCLFLFAGAVTTGNALSSAIGIG